MRNDTCGKIGFALVATLCALMLVSADADDLKNSTSKGRVLVFKDGFCSIEGPDVVMQKAGATFEFGPEVEYKGKKVQVQKPVSADAYVMGPVKIQIMTKTKQPSGTAKKLECRSQEWNEGQKTVDFSYRDDAIAVVVHAYMLAMGGFVIKDVECKDLGSSGKADPSSGKPSAGVGAENLKPGDIYVPNAAAATSHFNSSTSSKGPSGEDFVFVADELVPSKSGLLSDSLAKGKGQIVHGKGSGALLITCERVARLTADKLVLRIAEKDWEFGITKKTTVCEGSQLIDFSSIKCGDLVTVVTLCAHEPHVALSVRKGPLLVRIGGLGESSVPVDYDCESAQKGEGEHK